MSKTMQRNFETLESKSLHSKGYETWKWSLKKEIPPFWKNMAPFFPSSFWGYPLNPSKKLETVISDSQIPAWRWSQWIWESPKTTPEKIRNEMTQPPNGRHVWYLKSLIDEFHVPVFCKLPGKSTMFVDVLCTYTLYICFLLEEGNFWPAMLVYQRVQPR